jgi:glutamate synthase domain-containing protein 1
VLVCLLFFKFDGPLFDEFRHLRKHFSCLENLDHRGSVGADPLVGDGAGTILRLRYQKYLLNY